MGWGRGGAFGAHSRRVGRGWSSKRRPRRPQPAHLQRSRRPGSAWQAGPRPAIPPQHIWLPVPEPQPLSPGARNRRRCPPAAQNRAARPNSGGCRVRVAGPPSLTGTPPGTRAPLAPSPLTHCAGDEGARRLSRCWSCSGRSWMGSVGSSCRGAGSCQYKWGPPQVMEQLPQEDAGHPLHRALSPKRRQLVLLKSLNFVLKPHGPMGARRSHTRSNGKAVGGEALTQAQLEAAEAGPAARPSLLPPTPAARPEGCCGRGRGLGARPRLRPGRTWRGPTTHAPARHAAIRCGNRPPASPDFIPKAAPASV